MRRPMRPKGYDALRTELLDLKGQRPEIARAIEVARAHGDLSENADYDAAKEKSGMVEAKIRDISMKLSEAEVIDPSKLKDFSKIVFGLSAKILDLDTDKERVLSVVGAEESNIEKGLISYESPLGKALIGKMVGDDVQVKLPSGLKEYEVLEIFASES